MPHERFFDITGVFFKCLIGQNDAFLVVHQNHPFDKAVQRNLDPFRHDSGRVEVAQRYRDYLSAVYETATQGVDQGLADFELRPILLPKLEPWQEWAGFDIELGKHINSAFLEAEAAAF